MHGGNIWAAARETGRPSADWIDFSANINPLGTPPWVRAATETALTNLIHYPDPDSSGLAAAAARQYGLDPATIRFGNGAAELIHLLVWALAPKAGLVLAPTFSRYAEALRLVGARVDELPAWPKEPSATALTRWMEGAPDGSLLFLCTPNNPTGSLLPTEVTEAALAQKRHWVVVDEAFLDFVPGGQSLLPRVGTHPRLVVLRSMTKLYAIPSLRLGWLAGPAELVQRLARFQPPWSLSGPAQAAGLAALTGPDYVAPTQAAVARERVAFQQKLAPFYPWLKPLPAPTNYFLARLTSIAGTELQRRLQLHAILVRTCQQFSGLGDDYLRLAVRPATEADRLVTALQAVLGS